MSLSRPFDPATGVDGPATGALQVISVGFDAIVTNTVAFQRVSFPAGVGFEVTDIMVASGTVTSDPSLTIGSTVAGAEIVAAVNVTTNLGALTIVEGTVGAAGFIDVRVTADTGDAVQNLSVSFYGHNTSPPTSVPSRGPNAPEDS